MTPLWNLLDADPWLALALCLTPAAVCAVLLWAACRLSAKRMTFDDGEW